MGKVQSKPDVHVQPVKPSESNYRKADETKADLDSIEAQKTAVVIGFGSRGYGYACYSLAKPDKLKLVAVADPSDSRRSLAQEHFCLNPSQIYQSWEQLVEMDRLADIAIICTQDRMHKDPAIALARKGYHILLEKPMAVSLEDCCEIVDEVKNNGVLFGVGHVLRYYPQYRIIKKLIDEGTIGEICHIAHTEPIGFWHFAHSYVRGNWRKEEDSSCSLLAKCCHDLDLISYWMGEKKCTKISSFGSLMHFTPEHKPEGAADNCLSCPISKDCAFDAQKIYANPGWPTSVVCDSHDIEDLNKALRTGPYGRCVYNCDNDVMSNQTVNMQFEGGAVANVNMIALTKKVCARETSISGTKGEIKCNFGGPVTVYDFNTRKTTEHTPEYESIPFGLNAHGGADFHLIRTFVDAVIADDQSMVLAGPDETLYSHRLVFLAERARKESCVVDVD